NADSDELEMGVTYSVETVYTKHDRRFLTVGIGISSHSKSSAGKGNIRARFEVIDINTNEVLGSIQEYIYGGADTTWHTLTVDLGVPDFSTRKAFMFRLGKVTNTSDTFINAIVNRVSMGG